MKLNTIEMIVIGYKDNQLSDYGQSQNLLSDKDGFTSLFMEGLKNQSDLLIADLVKHMINQDANTRTDAVGFDITHMRERISKAQHPNDIQAAFYDINERMCKRYELFLTYDMIGVVA